MLFGGLTPCFIFYTAVNPQDTCFPSAVDIKHTISVLLNSSDWLHADRSPKTRPGDTLRADGAPWLRDCFWVHDVLYPTGREIQQGEGSPAAGIQPLNWVFEPLSSHRSRTQGESLAIFKKHIIFKAFLATPQRLVTTGTGSSQAGPATAPA